MLTALRAQFVDTSNVILTERLLNAFQTGQPIRLYDHVMRQSVTGLICGVRLESGYSVGQKPKHFLVDVCVDGFLIRDIYVKGV